MFIHDVSLAAPLPRPPPSRLSPIPSSELLFRLSHSSIIFEANQNGDRVDVSLKTGIRMTAGWEVTDTSG